VSQWWMRGSKQIWWRVVIRWIQTSEIRHLPRHYMDVQCNQHLYRFIGQLDNGHSTALNASWCLIKLDEDSKHLSRDKTRKQDGHRTKRLKISRPLWSLQSRKRYVTPAETIFQWHVSSWIPKMHKGQENICRQCCSMWSPAQVETKSFMLIFF
jgi:hypothetical protein